MKPALNYRMYVYLEPRFVVLFSGPQMLLYSSLKIVQGSFASAELRQKEKPWCVWYVLSDCLFIWFYMF